MLAILHSIISGAIIKVHTRMRSMYNFTKSNQATIGFVLCQRLKVTITSRTYTEHFTHLTYSFLAYSIAI